MMPIADADTEARLHRSATVMHTLQKKSKWFKTSYSKLTQCIAGGLFYAMTLIQDVRAVNGQGSVRFCSSDLLMKDKSINMP
jgi:hypothetical protein